MARKHNRAYRRRVRQAVAAYMLAFGTSNYKRTQSIEEYRFHSTVLQDLGIDYQYNSQPVHRYFRMFNDFIWPHLSDNRIPNYGYNQISSFFYHFNREKTREAESSDRARVTA